MLGRAGQDGAGFGDVAGHLLFQGLDAVEAAVGADEIDELDADLVAVKVAVEIEQDRRTGKSAAGSLSKAG